MLPMRMNVRQFVVALCSMAFLAGSADAANIRFFVQQGNGLYEIKGSTGGRFVTSPTGERISVNRFGTSPLIMPVVGYTDRAARNEPFVGVAEGSGQGTLSVTFTDQRTGRLGYILQPRTITLTNNSGMQIVPIETFKDNVTAVVIVGGRTDSRRLPIGRR
jgi:hypothetical protein